MKPVFRKFNRCNIYYIIVYGYIAQSQSLENLIYIIYIIYNYGYHEQTQSPVH